MKDNKQGTSEKGHHARSTGGETDTSSFSLNNFLAPYHIGMIFTIPILFLNNR